jgi:hypothetical protein
MGTTIKHLYTYEMDASKTSYGKNLLAGAIARKNIVLDG